MTAAPARRVSPRVAVAVVLAAVAAAYFLLWLGTALTRPPWCDEAWLASPSYNLVSHGRFVTTHWEGAGWFYEGMDRYTYQSPPLFYLAQAGWYKLAGFGLLAARATNLLWGLVVLAALFAIIRILTADRAAAALGCALLALDYHFVLNAAFARYDMMSCALAFTSIAVYLRLREGRLGWAVLASQSLAVAAGMTHPNGGLLAVGSLLLLAVWLDRRRLRWPMLALAAIPYVVAGAAWGLYIMQDFALFRRMFVGGSLGERQRFGLWTSIVREVTGRYLLAYGIGGHSVGHSGPIFLKVLVLAAYVAGLAGCLLARRLRALHGCRVLLALYGLFLAYFTFTERTKQTYYLVYVLPLLAALLAMWLAQLWRSRALPRWLVALGLAGVLLLQVGGTLYRMRLNTYARMYLPAVEFLRAHAGPRDLIVGSADLAFGLGFDWNVVDDLYLGHYSGKTARFYVVDARYEDAYQSWFAPRYPDIYAGVRRRVAAEYRKVYDYQTYRIYERVR